jgi:hypothetical protein
VCTTDLVCALWEKKRKEKKSVTALWMDADGQSSLFHILNELAARLGVPVVPQCVARIDLISLWSVTRQMDSALRNEEQVRL